jgi:hypothetical protein
VNHERFHGCAAHERGRGNFVIIGQWEVVHGNFPEFRSHVARGGRGGHLLLCCEGISKVNFFLKKKSDTWTPSHLPVDTRHSPSSQHTNTPETHTKR